IFGMFRSRMTMGENSSCRAARASYALEAVVTGKPALATSAFSLSRMSSSSSTIRTRGALASVWVRIWVSSKLIPHPASGAAAESGERLAALLQCPPERQGVERGVRARQKLGGRQFLRNVIVDAGAIAALVVEFGIAAGEHDDVSVFDAAGPQAFRERNAVHH